ncbi:MAG: transcriptional regulator [Proteobacteria bacterium]|nr:transcriptional regulator [Pseudomonadota bacterium]
MTLRKEMMRLLEEGPRTARELSQKIGVREKEILAHLPHVVKSLAAGKHPFSITPAQCLECGHKFRDRRRFTIPSRCPRCRSERIEPPVFSACGDG